MARSKSKQKRQTTSSRGSKAQGRNSAARERALKVLSEMRGGESLSRAARNNGVTVRTVKRYVGSALVLNRPGGRIRASKSDRLVCYFQISGAKRLRAIT